MVRPEGDLTLAALAERVEALERSGVAVEPPAPLRRPLFRLLIPRPLRLLLSPRQRPLRPLIPRPRRYRCPLRLR